MRDQMSEIVSQAASITRFECLFSSSRESAKASRPAGVLATGPLAAAECTGKGEEVKTDGASGRLPAILLRGEIRRGFDRIPITREAHGTPISSAETRGQSRPKASFVDRRSWHFHETGFPATSLLPPLSPTDLHKARASRKDRYRSQSRRTPL
jgi:hypothetical protein